MKIENRRYVVYVEFQDGTIQYANNAKYSSGAIGFTDDIVKAKRTVFRGGYYNTNVDKFRKDVIKHLKLRYKRSERPRTYIKRVVV